MSVQVLCPSCARVSEWHRAPVTECPLCYTSFPPLVREATERAVARERTPKPLLVTIGQWGSLMMGPIFLVVLGFAPFDAGTYSINGDVVPGPEFLRRAGWVFALFGGILLAIGIGLWRERAWPRPLMIGYWLAFVAIAFVDPTAATADVVGAVGFSAASAGVAAWYLYQKPNVRAYFESRETEAPQAEA